MLCHAGRQSSRNVLRNQQGPICYAIGCIYICYLFELTFVICLNLQLLCCCCSVLLFLSSAIVRALLQPLLIIII